MKKLQEEITTLKIENKTKFTESYIEKGILVYTSSPYKFLLIKTGNQKLYPIAESRIDYYATRIYFIQIHNQSTWKFQQQHKI